MHEFRPRERHGRASRRRSALYKEIQDAYAEAKANGLFKGHYAENTVAEYWAEGTQWWFWSNFEWHDGDKRLQITDDLKAYDPRLFAIFEKVYAGHHIPADVSCNTARTFLPSGPGAASMSARRSAVFAIGIALLVAGSMLEVRPRAQIPRRQPIF